MLNKAFHLAVWPAVQNLEPFDKIAATSPFIGEIDRPVAVKTGSPVEADRTLRGKSHARPPAMVRGKNSGRM